MCECVHIYTVRIQLFSFPVYACVCGSVCVRTHFGWRGRKRRSDDLEVIDVCCTTTHTETQSDTLQQTATNCNTMPHTATHHDKLQETATHCQTRNKLEQTASHCITLQHTATCCNKVARTAAHCNPLQDTATHHDLEDKQSFEEVLS